jgi:hypothetical protein
MLFVPSTQDPGDRETCRSVSAGNMDDAERSTQCRLCIRRTLRRQRRRAECQRGLLQEAESPDVTRFVRAKTDRRSFEC